MQIGDRQWQLQPCGVDAADGHRSHVRTDLEVVLYTRVTGVLCLAAVLFFWWSTNNELELRFSKEPFCSFRLRALFRRWEKRRYKVPQVVFCPALLLLPPCNIRNNASPLLVIFRIQLINSNAKRVSHSSITRSSSCVIVLSSSALLLSPLEGGRDTDRFANDLQGVSC